MKRKPELYRYTFNSMFFDFEHNRAYVSGIDSLYYTNLSTGLETTLFRETSSLLGTYDNKIMFLKFTIDSPGFLMRMNNDGSNLEILKQDFDSDLWNLGSHLTPVYDKSLKKMYCVTDVLDGLQSTIKRCNYDLSDLEEILTVNNEIKHLTLDLPENKMYWISYTKPRLGQNYKYGLHRADLDGTNVEDLTGCLS